MNALQWPALDVQDSMLPEQLEYERGIWGKVHGASSDYRWIATTAAFAGARNRIERELTFGAEDEPQTFAAWRSRGKTCYAISCYRSGAVDASGRSGFLEKQIIEWERSPAMPSALAALYLLPQAARFDSSIYWDRCGASEWLENEFSLNLEEASHPPLPVARIEERIDAAVRRLTATVSQESLAEFYAMLLAGGRAVSLRGVTEPLPAEALAALLLPLPREIADGISMTSWLPATSIDMADVRRQWNIAVGGAAAITRMDVAPDAEQIELGRLMAGCLFAGDPKPLVETTQTHDSTSPIRLTLWGPSASGKTVLLANLYLQRDKEWDVYPTEKSYEFIQQMRDRMLSQNVFPSATTVAEPVGIEYLFRHRESDLCATLALEDRAGVESEELQKYDEDKTKSLKTRLATADGLVLLFDPVADRTRLETRVWRTLELVHIASRRGARKDERPIAVCVSKADVLIETAADFWCAVRTPHEFVRDRVPPSMIYALERFCSDFRLFPVSAAGVHLRYGVIEPTVFFGEDLQPRICPGGRAFNLMTPFAWLLNRLTEARA